MGNKEKYKGPGRRRYLKRTERMRQAKLVHREPSLQATTLIDAESNPCSNAGDEVTVQSNNVTLEEDSILAKLVTMEKSSKESELSVNVEGNLETLKEFPVTVLPTSHSNNITEKDSVKACDVLDPIPSTSRDDGNREDLNTRACDVLDPIPSTSRDDGNKEDLNTSILISTEKSIEIQEKKVGRRIVNVSQFSTKILELCNHSPFCSANDIVLIGEKQCGLISKFTYKCRMCNEKFLIDSDFGEDNYIDLNKCAVSGAIATGGGHAQLEELFSAMDLPNISERLYSKNHDLIFKHWVQVSEENMIEAGKKEKEIAVANGKVTKDGLGIIDVLADGCWCKRSYKNNYSAASGAATLIGKNTGEILYMGVKNKYCATCSKTDKDKTEKKEHTCFKNYDGSSTGMESEIIVEGFKQSVEQHGLIYGRLISDGDSSTYAKILEARPYPDVTVEKIECRNHLLRNFCNKLRGLTAETKYPIRHRKHITKQAMKDTRCAIVKCIDRHKNDSDVQLLFQDILMSHHHGFGNHIRCKPYMCDKVGMSINDTATNEFFSCPLWQRICFIMENLANHSRSLIHDVTSNKVEGFHSVVAKFVGGKRINYAKKNSYELRVHAASVAFTKKKAISRLYKSINGGYSPLGKIKKLEEKRIKKGTLNRRIIRTKRRLFTKASGTNKDYGEGSTKPDLDKDSYDRAKQNFLERLKKTDDEIAHIQKNTVLQSESGEWLELRRTLLTASNFGKIIKKREDTSCANTVKNMLYKTNIDHVKSIKHGRDNEKIALKQLSAQINATINRCGLFIDRELPYLGATPDGVCNEQIVEIKCPITAHAIGIEEAIRLKKITFWKPDGSMNKTHDWYFQIQGQLRVTQRKECVFAVWANDKEPMKIEIVERDDEFWRIKMEPKLTKFYMDCILPELIDPRQPRNMAIRDPSYIKAAKDRKKTKKRTISDVNSNN